MHTHASMHTDKHKHKHTHTHVRTLTGFSMLSRYIFSYSARDATCAPLRAWFEGWYSYNMHNQMKHASDARRTTNNGRHNRKSVTWDIVTYHNQHQTQNTSGHACCLSLIHCFHPLTNLLLLGGRVSQLHELRHDAWLVQWQWTCWMDAVFGVCVVLCCVEMRNTEHKVASSKFIG